MWNSEDRIDDLFDAIEAPFAIAVNPKTHKAVEIGLDGDLMVIDGLTLAVSSPSIPQSEQ